MRHATVLLLFLLASLAIATSRPASAQPDAYSKHWPVQADDAGIYGLNLTPALYAQIQRPDLGDLAAFNGAGEALGFAPLTRVWKVPEPQWHTVHWFALPVRDAGGDEGLSLVVERAADGSVSLRASVEATSGSERVGDLLIDTGIDDDSNQRLLALAFDLDPAVSDLSAQVRIDASDDLESWRTIVESASILRLQQGGQLLERQQIELDGQKKRYLRLHRLDTELALPLKALRVQTRAGTAPDPRPRERLAAELVSHEGRTSIFRLPARIPVERVNLRLAQDNTVAVANLSSRESERDTWRLRGSLTVFQLRAAGVELDNEALKLGGRRDRHWRVEFENDLAQAPTLEFSYRPERWLLLTQGQGPYLVAAGSTKSVRAEMPLAALLAPIRAKYGDDWQPPDASLGEPVIAAGDAATEATLQERWSSWVLWMVLIGSALAIGWMVLRLLRESPPGEDT